MEGVELYSLKLPEPSDPEIDKLCEEFRTLSTALAVTSVLSPNDDRFWTDTRTWPELDAPEDLKTKLLNAITSYMSRSDENVAALSQTRATSTPRAELMFDITILDSSSSRDNISDMKHESDTSGVSHSCTETNGIESGNRKDVSHWDSLLNGDWNGIKSYQCGLSLESHLMTLVDYLKNTVSLRQDTADNLKARYKLTHKFSRYVVETCWPKMWRRIRNPISQGIVYVLHGISEVEIRSCHASWVERSRDIAGQKDTILRAILESPEWLPVLHEVLCLHAAPSSRGEDGGETEQRNGEDTGELSDKPFLHLLQSLIDADEIPQKGITAASTYTQDSCVDFHRLLVGTFLGYGRALCKLHYAMTNSKETADGKNCISKVYRTAYLLNVLMDSSIFHHHLDALSDNLHLPSAFDEKEGLMLFNAKSLEPNGQDVQDSVSVASSVSISADDECNDEFAEEISSNVHWQQGRTRNRAKMYGRLLRLHVSHIHAVRDLMRFCVASKLAPKFKFHFIKAPLISGVKSMLSWRETFKNALRPLYDTDSPDRLDQDVEHAVNAFTSAIKECKSERIGYRMHALKKSLESNDDLFTMSSPPGKFQFKGGLHGEAVLASIMSSPGLTGLGNHAEAVIKCMDDNVIGVSKLCCATCWEILNTLRGNDREIFAVRGCHKAFGDVELPTWLPKDAILKIMGALRYHLRNTLNSMIKAENAKSSRSPECSWEDELNQIHDDNLDIDFDLDDVFF